MTSWILFSLFFLFKVPNYGSVLVPGEKIFKSYIGDNKSYVGPAEEVICPT